MQATCAALQHADASDGKGGRFRIVRDANDLFMGVVTGVVGMGIWECELQWPCFGGALVPHGKAVRLARYLALLHKIMIRDMTGLVVLPYASLRELGHLRIEIVSGFGLGCR